MVIRGRNAALDAILQRFTERMGDYLSGVFVAVEESEDDVVRLGASLVNPTAGDYGFVLVRPGSGFLAGWRWQCARRIRVWLTLGLVVRLTRQRLTHTKARRRLLDYLDYLDRDVMVSTEKSPLTPGPRSGGLLPDGEFWRAQGHR